VSIIDSLPEGITVVAGSITPGGSVANRVITFTTFNLASNDSTLLTYKLTIDSSIQNGVLHTNIATITANGARTQVTASFTPVNRPFMTITKNVNAPSAKPSDTLTYTATYTNNGTAVATVVIVTDAVPQYTTYVLQSVILNNVSKSDESDGDEVVVSGGIITINVGTVSPGQTGTIKYKVKIN
jgi:uncharacterized repeat protein (TIGR01451 family)